jgi:hypothetical protein
MEELNVTNSPFNRFSYCNSQNTAWWLEVYAISPECLYYFGPFESRGEARQHQSGYIEDLHNENSLGIRCKIQQINPQHLTIFQE